MAKVFLCYRSRDDGFAAVLLDEKLSGAFGPDEVFMASRSIEPGEIYSAVIERALKECETMLVLIGPRWVDTLQENEADAAAGTVDWVRHEISTAFANGTRVIPLLLSRTPRLDPHLLPSDIAALADYKYLTFDHRNVSGSLNQIIAALQTGDRARR
ncbi:hypothetical protein GCM10009839_45400 [Catenulispora yoronensis]|uniref:TIR domain-containing protein n=1 Tax=Catenulispora yoronensis TaxID=450799 RepID=A0ABP5G668_9ACTN